MPASRQRIRLPCRSLPAIVAGIKGVNPDITLKAICERLEAMRERTPRGRTSWQPSSVKMLLERAKGLGMLENSGATDNQAKGLTIRN